MIPPVLPGKVLSNRVLRSLRARAPLWRFLQAFCAAAGSAGGGTYLVGGFVRDLVERLPGKDVDLMVTGIGFDALGEALRSLDPGPLGIRRIFSAGKRFAVYKVLTTWADDAIDVALARSGKSPGRGHRPLGLSTEEASARDDASRRDFTMNTLMFRLAFRGADLGGGIIDHFGGLADLRRRWVRGVGDPRDRFREDPVRLLRAIRLKNERPGFAIERRTWQALTGEASALVGRIPGDQLVAELSRSLAADPSATVTDLHRCGILAALLPEIPDWSAGPLARVKRRYRILEASLGRPLPETPMLANLLVDLAENEAAELLERSRRPHPVPARRPFPRLASTAAAARRLHLPRLRKTVRMLEDLARLTRVRPALRSRAWIEALFSRQENPGHLLALYAATQRAASRREKDLRALLRKAAATPSLLSGDDILSMGIPPGPQVETILFLVREATLAGEVTDRRDALRLAGTLHAEAQARRRLHRGRTSSRRVRRSPISARMSTEESGTRYRREAISSNMKNDDRSGPA